MQNRDSALYRSSQLTRNPFCKSSQIWEKHFFHYDTHPFLSFRHLVHQWLVIPRVGTYNDAYRKINLPNQFYVRLTNWFVKSKHTIQEHCRQNFISWQQTRCICRFYEPSRNADLCMCLCKSLVSNEVKRWMEHSSSFANQSSQLPHQTSLNFVYSVCLLL